jgi:two-component system sensor histidine kinase/response regulator
LEADGTHMEISLSNHNQNNHSQKVLIVDDDELVLESFEKIFKETTSGLHIEKTTDGKQALKMIADREYDIIITDLVMPGIDGIQLLKKAKQIQPDAEVILITAYSSYNSAVDALYFGATDYISKPINAGELKSRISRAVEKREALIEKQNKILEMERLFYTVAHDFKATILSVKSFSEILSNDYREKLDDEGQFLIDRICSNLSVMESITEGLLEFSKIGKVNELWENIDTSDILKEIIVNYSPALKEKRISLTIEGGLPPIYFYRRGLQRIFSNLIDNSIKYTRPDADSWIKIGSTDIGPLKTDGLYQFFIEDNGIGIAPESREHIFDLFHRENGSIHVQGYGIGLALVKKILETANCEITVKSQKNKKTVFYFTLPAARMSGT